MKMNYTEILKQLEKYYSNLLIIQYNGKPKAKATIELMTKLIWSNMALLQIRDGFDWKTAKGVQLDIIGKWLGISRNYNENNTWNNTYLSYPAYGTETVAESDVLRGGYSTYSDFDTLEGGMLTYSDLQADSQMLDDEDYRTVIGLKIIKNSIEHNQGNIDEAIGLYFAEKDTEGNVIFTDFNLQKFTVVGSPTVTTDGIASGFTNNNYLTVSPLLPDRFKISCKVQAKANSSTNKTIFVLYLNNNNTIRVAQAFNFYFLNGRINSTNLTFSKSQHIEPVIDNIYSIDLNYENGILQLLINGVVAYQSTVDLSSFIAANPTLYIGKNPQGTNTYPYQGSIDLKDFNITSGNVNIFNSGGYKHILNPVVYTTWQPHQITYNYPSELSTILNICLYKGVLPAPTGCQIQLSSY